VTTEARPYWRHEFANAWLIGFYGKDERLAQEIFQGWQDGPRPDDVFPADESIRSWEFPEDIELYGEVPLEETWIQAPLADDVEDPSGQKVVEVPDDLELYEEIPLEETWVQQPLSDDVADGVGTEFSEFLHSEPEPDPDGHSDFQIPDDNDPLPPSPEVPADIELFDEVPVEETWVSAPLADDVEDQSGQTISSVPDDIELFDETPLEETSTDSPRADDVEDPLLGVTSVPDDIELFDEVPLEDSWLASPLADDNDPLPAPTEIPADIELFDETPLEETWTLGPLAENVEDFLLGVTWVPEDIELFSEIPLVESWTAGPPPDDVEEPTVGDQEVPEDIELYDDVPLEQTWAFGPLSDDRPEDPGLGVMEWPTDLSDYEEDRESEIPLVFLAPIPDDFHDCVEVAIAVEPVVKGDTVVPFTVTVTRGASFVDADLLPMAFVYRKTTVGPFALQASPALVKRPASSGLYDGVFATSVIAVGGAPDTYVIYSDVKVADHWCRWSGVVMAIGPC